MTTQHEIRKSVAFVAMLLGNFAVMWGMFILPIYGVGFLLLSPQQRGAPASLLTGRYLPFELPLIGLVLATLSLLSAWGEHARKPLVPAFLGLVLNAIPMALALILWTLRSPF